MVGNDSVDRFISSQDTAPGRPFPIHRLHTERLPRAQFLFVSSREAGNQDSGSRTANGMTQGNDDAIHVELF